MTVENVEVEVVTEVEMAVETTEVSIAETTDALEASDMGSTGAFMAIGAGGGNAGALAAVTSSAPGRRRWWR